MGSPLKRRTVCLAGFAAAEGGDRPLARLLRLFRNTQLALVALCSFALAQMAVAPAFAGSRVALVLATEDYAALPKSTIGVSRAKDIAAALEERGFEVLMASNPTNAGGRASLRDFSAKTAGADVAVAVLVGHGIATGGQTYFLPSNTEIGRATDLMSRGLAVANIAQIVGRAKQGGVFFFMTLPSFAQPLEGLDPRPQYASDVLPNVVVAISNSSRIPLSRVDATGAEAAKAFADAVRASGSSLADAARAASSGGLDFVVGTAAAVDLSAPATVPAGETSQPAGPSAAELARRAEEEAARQADADAKLNAERLAREAAEKKAREEEGRVKLLQAETQKAQADSRKAQADLQRAQAEAQRAQAEAQKAQAEAQKALADAERTRAEAEKARREALAEAERVRQEAQSASETAKREAQSAAELARQEAQKTADKAQQDALAEAERVKEDARRLEEQAAAARAEAEQAREAKQKAEAEAALKLAALAAQSQAAPPPPPAAPKADKPASATPLDESTLGQDQRRKIQEKLRDLGLYSGRVDGTLGPMTREAITWYQKSRGLTETGILTLEQYQALVSEPD